MEMEIFSGRHSSSEKSSASVPRPNNEDKYSANSPSDKCSPEKSKQKAKEVLKPRDDIG